MGIVLIVWVEIHSLSENTISQKNSITKLDAIAEIQRKVLQAFLTNTLSVLQLMVLGLDKAGGLMLPPS